MEIKIPLILPDTKNGTYKELKASLKQLELSVHHAQKSVESSERDGIELVEGGLTYAVIVDSNFSPEENNACARPIIFINLDQVEELKVD